MRSMSVTNRRPAELHQYKGDDQVDGDSLYELNDLLLVRHRVLACLNFVFVEKPGPLIIIEECEEDVA